MDTTWEAEEIIESPKRQENSDLSPTAFVGSVELDSDFADLLFDGDVDSSMEEITSVDELNNLFGDALLDEDKWNQTESANSNAEIPTTGNRRRSHSDLFSMQESADDLEALFAGTDQDEKPKSQNYRENNVNHKESEKSMEWDELWNNSEAESLPVESAKVIQNDASLDFESLFNDNDNSLRGSSVNLTNTSDSEQTDKSIDLSDLLAIGEISNSANSSSPQNLEEIKPEWGDLEIDGDLLFEEEFIENNTNSNDEFNSLFFENDNENSSEKLTDISVVSQADDLESLFSEITEVENNHKSEGKDEGEEDLLFPSESLSLPVDDKEFLLEEEPLFDNSFNDLFEESGNSNGGKKDLSDDLFVEESDNALDEFFGEEIESSVDTDSLFDEELNLDFESASSAGDVSPTDTNDSDDLNFLLFGESVEDSTDSLEFLEELQPKEQGEIIFDEELNFDELMGEIEENIPQPAPLPSIPEPIKQLNVSITESKPVKEKVSKTKEAESEDNSLPFLLLEAFLEQPSTEAFFESHPSDPAAVFSELEAFLNQPLIIEETPKPTLSQGIVSAVASELEETSIETHNELDGMEADEFADLHELLRGAEKSMPGGRMAQKPVAGTGAVAGKKQKSFVEQTMRVPIKQLDNLSNLVGELVVNRNSLEQDQERLRQFLDNLLHQVSQLSDVGQRMQDLYERSLLEISLLSSRQHYQAMRSGKTNSHSTGAAFDALEMDRFTGFHTQSQEIIELIVRVRESAADIEFLVDETEQVTRQLRQITTQLQEGLTRARMVPFSSIEKIFPLARAVRDKAIEHEKQAEVRLEGRDTMLDKLILEHLSDPLKHLINNAIAHGIETPAVRVAAGKPPVGRITVRSFHQGNQTVISFSDDGAGIDTEKVKRKAVEKRLITPAEAALMTRPDVYELLYHPGFSTMEKANMTAGRGVGMDVIRNDLSEIRGVISTDSTVGKGTTFTIRLPLTLSISKALCCISDRARIAFPMDGVEDMLDVPRDRVQVAADGQMSIAWRDSMLSFRHLRELLGYNRHLGRGNVYGTNAEDDVISVVVLRSAGNYLALEVDQVLGEQEIVIKQLEGPVPKPIGVAGATVMGDGRIVAIADVLELIDLAAGRIRKEAGGNLWDAESSPPLEIVEKNEPTVLIVDDSITVRELLSMTFNKAGYRVEQARDGQEAWEKLRSGLPCDIVFCDIEMPRMDGLELLSRMQKDPILTDLPIAMLTSRGADRHRQMAVSLGARGYFTKPYLEEALLEAATRMLKGEVLVMTKGE